MNNVIKFISKNRSLEKVVMFLINISPKSVIYFCVIRMWAKTTTGKYGNTDITKITVDEMLRRWK